MDWKDLTLGKYVELQAVMASDEYEDIIAKDIAIVSIIYDCDAGSLPLPEYAALTAGLGFLSAPPTKAPIRAKYALNGRDYSPVADVSQITLSQFLDYDAAARSGDIIAALAALLLPTGKEYLDGYDVETVKDDIATLSTPDALGLLAFFFGFMGRYAEATLRCLRRRMKRMRMKTAEDMEAKERLIKEVEALETLLSPSR